MKIIRNVCVIGAGIMGRQIALNAAVSGFTATLADVFPDALENARKWVGEYLERSVSKGKMNRKNADEAMARMSYVQDISQAVADADLVVEAIVEKEDVKRELFTQVNASAPVEAIITSNSSYMSSSAFKEIISNPSRLANLHYFNPAMRMELVEIVRGPHTGEDTIKTLVDFVAAVGKRPLLVNKEIEGFVVNRLLRAVQDEAFFLLANGIATARDIDLGAEKGLNYPMGPFRLMDLTGLDLNYYNRRKKYEETGREEDLPPAELTEKFHKKEWGRKTGKGWYDYPAQ